MLKSDKVKQTPPTLVWSNSDLEWNRDGMSRYFEVCVDGAYSMSSGLSGCGGVIMEHTGGMIEAFTCGIKARNSLEAELWGCICGLRRAWNLDFKLCKLWTDAMEVLELLKKNEYERHESMELIRELKMLLARDWRVQVAWRSREDNTHAVFFAKQALQMGVGLRLMTREEATALLALDGMT